MAVIAICNCDLCKLEIKPETPFANIDIPLSEADRNKFRENAKAHAPAGLLNLMPLDQMIPQRWRLEVCTGCMSGFMSGVFDIVSDAVTAYLTRRRGPVVELHAAPGGDE